MPRLRTLIVLSVLLVCASLVSGCATTASTFEGWPSAEDLTIAAKPRLDPARVGSDAANQRHNARIETWGEGLALQLGRICRGAQRLGRAGLDCPDEGEVRRERLPECATAPGAAGRCLSADAPQAARLREPADRGDQE